MSEVQVLVQDADKRRALAALLEGRYEVNTDGSVVATDLYLVDTDTASARRDALREQKRAAGPVFRPVVLIRPDDAPDEGPPVPDQEANQTSVVDEVITTPLDYDTVVWRLDNLLTRRDTTRNLVEQNERLQERERELERYQTFVEQSSDIITVLDESGVVQYQSPAIGRVLGYDKDELLGQNAFELIHPDNRPEL